MNRPITETPDGRKIPSKLRTSEDLDRFVEEANRQISVLHDRYADMSRAYKLGFSTGSTGSGGLEKTGKLFRAVAKRGASGELSDEEVELIRSTRPGHFVKASLGTPLVSDSTTGSYAVPVEFHNEVIRVVEESSQLFPLVRKVSMRSKTKSVPTKGTGLAFTYVANQADDVAEASPTFNQETLSAETFACYVPVSEEFMEDEAVEIGEYFRDLVSEAFTASFEGEFLTASGSPSTGILNDAGVVQVTMGTGNTSFDSIDFVDFVAMESALAEVKGALRGARWLMSPYLWNRVRALKNADGDPLIAPWTDAGARQILGYPVVLSYEMPDSGDSAKSTNFLALGNPKNLIYGDRLGLEVRYYDGTRYSVTNGENFFRFRYRAGYNVPIPGAFAKLRTSAS
jgi:HK97 family phage major capsid protein